MAVLELLLGGGVGILYLIFGHKRKDKKNEY
jgi:hypothetical protein